MYESRIKYVPMNVGLSVPTPPSGIDSWVNAVENAGGSVSATQRTNVGNLIDGLIADGLYSGRIWLHAGESVSQQATIDIVERAIATPTLLGSLDATGYTGDGVDGYIDYGALPASYTQNSATFGVYNMLNSIAQNVWVTMGVAEGGTVAYIFAYFNASGALARINEPGGNPALAGGNTNRQGFFIATRRASNDRELYKNGVSVQADSEISNAAPTIGFYGLAANNSGSPSNFGQDTIGATVIMGGLTDTQVSNLSSRINTYMTAWGVNVY